ncbi:MAG: hypothetical protein KGH71_05670 [Candidatus Micrarchaeota archaeon]|nr:hypothetical protein [Candidatus Micrarchaeota archaeon]
MDEIVNRSVRVDARSKENMFGHTQRFGDFARSMRVLSELKREVMKEIKGEKDEQTEKLLDLIYRQDGKVRITGEAGKGYLGNFAEFMKGRRGEKSVLEVGCSKPDPEAIGGWKSYTGVDLYEDEFFDVEKRLGVELIGTEATYLPFRDRSFDYAIAYGVVPMLGVNAYFGIKELGRVSREGIAFTVGHEDSIEAWAAKRKEDREILGYPPREDYVIEFDYCKGVFPGRPIGPLSIESAFIYFNEKRMTEFLVGLGFAEVNIFIEPYKVIEEGRGERIVKGSMEIIAIRRT